MKRFFSILSIISFVSYSVALNGQNDSLSNKWAVQLSLKHQDIPIFKAFSIGQLAVLHEVKIRPYYTLDIQHNLKSKKPNLKFAFSTQLGYYRNLYRDRWLSYKVGTLLEWQFFKRCYLITRIELGHAFVKDADVQYIYENNKWIPTSNFDSFEAGFIASPRVDVAYRVINSKNPIDVLLTTDATLIYHPNFGRLPYFGFGGGVRYGF
ncbi:MAG: hypothetical protein AAF806_12920 [Bacteroidota bacterium]